MTLPIRRGSFLLLGLVPMLRIPAARGQSDIDPASSSRTPALRVLLGVGDAVATSASSFRFSGRSYRGTFQRLADAQVVNFVALEDYLYSVVPREMPSRWPQAALEAQAISARTYVLQRSDPRRQYDLIPSELDQVYDGIDSETPSSRSAVDSTAGQVLKFGDGFARVAYSSCCGGHTEASADAWGAAPVPYLQGIVCTWCAASPNYRWATTLPLQSIATRFASMLSPNDQIEAVQIADRDASGRARGFLLITKGSSVVVQGSAFRRALGARVLPSLLVTALQSDAAAGDIAITGGGLGHGVGLCQWGARGMALAGRAPGEILTAYFPGAVITNLDR